MAKVSKRLRFEILRRDGFKCRYCGALAEATELRVDHVIPEALGGTSEPANLATACDPCNSGKSSVSMDGPIVDEVADDALRWSAAMERAAADMEYRLRERDGQNAVFLDEWNAYTFDFGQERFPLDPTWSASVTRLRTAGLTDSLIIEAVNVTMGAGKVLPENRFRYFCGVAWNMVTQLQEAAEKIASREPEDEEEMLFPDRSRDDLAATLDLFRAVTENFLWWLPPSVRKRANEDTQRDAEETGKLDASYEERLAFFLLFAAMDLRDCQFRISESEV